MPLQSDLIDSRDAITDTGDLNRRHRTALIWLGSTTAIWQALSWALTVITVRVLTPHDYGMAGLAETVTPVVATVAGCNLTAWLIRDSTRSRSQEESVFSLTLVLGAMATTLTIAAAPFLSRFYAAPEFRLPLQVLSLIFLLQAIQAIPTARLQRDLQYKAIAIMNLTIGVTRSVLTFALAFFGFGYWALFIGLLQGELTRTVWLAVAGGLPRRLRWDWAVNRVALAFGIPVTGATLLWLAYSTSDNIVVGRMFTVEVLGIYATAFYLADMPLSKINSVIQPTMLPYFCGLRHDLEAVAREYLTQCRAIAYAIFPVLAGMATTASQAVPLIMGSRWASLVRPLQVMCVVAVIRSLTMNTQPLFLALNQPRLLFASQALIALVLPPSFLALAWWFGVRGVYGAWLTVFPPTSFLVLVMLGRAMGMSPWRVLVNYRGPVIASGIMAIAVALAGRAAESAMGPAAVLAVQVCAGLVVYGVIVRVCFRSDFDLFLARARSQREA